MSLLTSSATNGNDLPALRDAGEGKAVVANPELKAMGVAAVTVGRDALAAGDGKEEAI